MKRVLSIQDLSCLGTCSLTVALPVLSAMGCTCTPLPTTVLSSHTGFPDPHVRCLTEDIEPTLRHWLSVGAEFDAISVGYLADPAQAKAVETVLDAFNATVILDPVMGDHGKRYDRLTPEHTAAVRQLCCKADVLLPNVTEACLLTGISYREQGGASYYWELLDALRAFHANAVILTGAELTPGETGFIGFDGTEQFSYQSTRLPQQCHGTGDLFAAVVTGAFAKGKSIQDAATLAAQFVEQVLHTTPESTPFGVAFESRLPWLWEQKQKQVQTNP